MNRLVWKLLRKHLSIGQLLGFFLANLLGMCIVLCSLQVYNDVLPIFTQGDSFMKQTYLVVGKQVSAFHTLRGKTPSFSAGEIADFEQQPFVKQVGRFTPALFDIYASLGSKELGMGFSTDMFFEAIPDEYLDVDLSNWHYASGDEEIPIVLPKNYLNLYNFGFASTKGLPAISEGVVGMIRLNFRLRGTKEVRYMTGRVVAFSNRLNTILVPQSFMDEANALLSPDRKPVSSRLILDVKNPADERIATYLDEHGYTAESGGADAGRMTYFLRVIIGIVLTVGLVICALSFYVLLLSIFLLLQKHTEKIDNLLLIGYTPLQVAMPFHILSFGLNLLVLLLALAGVGEVQSVYFPQLQAIYPDLQEASSDAVLYLGLALFALVSLLNYFAIRYKVVRIWYIHRK